MSSSLRRVVWAAAAAAAGTVALAGGPASAQVDPCYPPTPGCVSTSSSSVGVTVVVGNRETEGTGNGTSDEPNLARTGAVVIPTALVGVGLVAGGLALKRSGKRGKSSKTA